MNKKILVSIGVVIVLAGSVWYFMSTKNPGEKNISSTEATQAPAQPQTDEVQVLDDSGTDLALQAVSLLSTANKNAEPAAKLDLIKFAVELKQSASLLGLESNFAFGSEVAPVGSTPGNVRFNLGADGTYAQLISYLKLIQAYQYPMSLRSVQARLQFPDKPVLTLVVSGNIYFK